LPVNNILDRVGELRAHIATSHRPSNEHTKQRSETLLEEADRGL